MKPEAPTSGNVVMQPDGVSPAEHQALGGHRGAVVWLTGLPGSGKSTIARAAQQHLHQSKFRTMLLDGDNLRHSLCADLGFSVADRIENVRRTAEVAKLFMETGVVVFVALVSPMRQAREAVRRSLPAAGFMEIYCQCALAVCQQRDPKGHYLQAASGTITNFTGISSPYEEPLTPALCLDTGQESAQESVRRLTQYLLTQLSNLAPTGSVEQQG